MRGIRTHRHADSNSDNNSHVDDQPASFPNSNCLSHPNLYPHRHIHPLPNFLAHFDIYSNDHAHA